jgi:hypothetical protein
MLLTDEEIEASAKTGGVSWTGYRVDSHGFYTIPILSPYHYQFAKAVERAVLEKLCAGVSMPKAAGECEVPTEAYVMHPGDTVKIVSAYTADQLRAYGAACRLKALEDAEKKCEAISDEYHDREGMKYPELKTDAQTGARDCEIAIRALKGEA